VTTRQDKSRKKKKKKKKLSRFFSFFLFSDASIAKNTRIVMTINNVISYRQKYSRRINCAHRPRQSAIHKKKKKKKNNDTPKKKKKKKNKATIK
jgi:hypothetical protein